MPKHRHPFFQIASMLIVCCLILAVLAPAGTIAAAGGVEFTVNEATDADDASPGDGRCDTNLALALDQCSLRAAIQESNSLAGAETIRFADLVVEIRLTKPLPPLSAQDNNGTKISGYRQGKMPGLTTLTGADLTKSADGLVLQSDFHRVQGLIITSFKGHGIVVNGNNNVIGVDGDGISDATEQNIIILNDDGIAGNFLDNGIHISGDSNSVAGNWIGLAASGTSGAPNGSNGITLISGASRNRIGTNSDGVSDSLERNLIAGDHLVGLSIFEEANQNVVTGNGFGLDSNGLGKVGSMRNCLEVSGARNQIGTNGDGVRDSAERNVFAGAFSYGLIILGEQNTIAGNYIGTNAAGTAAIANYGGVLLGGVGNVIGVDGNSKNDTAAEGNWIAGNDGPGIEVYGMDVSGNTIAGNVFGGRPSDRSPMPNSAEAIWAYRGTGLVIGTDGDGVADSVEGNTIISSGMSGILVQSNAITNTVIAGNMIGEINYGIADNGIEINGAHGIRIGSNLDGHSDAEESNTIQKSTYSGIWVHSGSTGVDILQNEITANFALGVGVEGELTRQVRISRNILAGNNGPGIDLIGAYGVDANDAGDTDIGPNLRQNHPVVKAAESSGSRTLVMVTLSTATNAAFDVELFYSPTCDASGHGEGMQYITTLRLYTGLSGIAGAYLDLPAGLPAGHYVTATATDEAGNTSEFSACRLIENRPAQLSRVFLPAVIR